MTSHLKNLISKDELELDTLPVRLETSLQFFLDPSGITKR